jgi:three-Cys-motif partner protein
VDYTKLPRGEDDGLPIMDVGSWAREKYVRVWMYDQLFSTGMKNKWDERVYVDLFAGPGFSQIKGTKEILHGSPLLALDVADRFDRYVFCEKDADYLEALKKRVARIAPGVDARYVAGEADVEVARILENIPAAGPTHTVLTFVFVDPFSVEFKFETIRRLATRFADFLIVLALHMDANRNLRTYLKPSNQRIELFLDDADWRAKWAIAEKQGRAFTAFLARGYAEAMERLKYRKTSLEQMYHVKSGENNKNLPLYYLAFFSRAGLGYTYWDEVLKYTGDPEFDFGTTP